MLEPVTQGITSDTDVTILLEFDGPGDVQILPTQIICSVDGDANVTLPDAVDYIPQTIHWIDSTNGTVTVLADVTIDDVNILTTDVSAGFFLARNVWRRVA